MKKIALASLLFLVLSACSLIEPYKITFTTPNESVFNPQTDTLDLALNQEALAYVSSFKCEGQDKVELLPVVNDDSEDSNVYNLNLSILKDQKSGVECEINVTAFDRTTTANSNKSISLYMYTKAVPMAKENEFCGGIAAIECDAPLVCVYDNAEMPDSGGLCQKEVTPVEEEVVVEEVVEDEQVETEVSTEVETTVETELETGTAVTEEVTNE